MYLSSDAGKTTMIEPYMAKNQHKELLEVIMSVASFHGVCTLLSDSDLWMRSETCPYDREQLLNIYRCLKDSPKHIIHWRTAA